MQVWEHVILVFSASKKTSSSSSFLIIMSASERDASCVVCECVREKVYSSCLKEATSFFFPNITCSNYFTTNYYCCHVFRYDLAGFHFFPFNFFFLSMYTEVCVCVRYVVK